MCEKEAGSETNVLADATALLLFGYGSIIWKQEFEYTRTYPCFVTGYQRVFYQGSSDHRGVPEKPGRVVTLLSTDDPRASVVGVAFELPVEREKREKILAQLDHRERGGYKRIEVTPYHLQTHQPLELPPGAVCLCYIATEENSEYAGAASEEVIAAQILECWGTSGPNSEYLFKLAAALKALNATDPHVFAVEAAARKLMGKAGNGA